MEMVVWLPTLCYKMGVPFVIVKGKSRLGKLVHMKTATCVCLTGVNSEDGTDLENLKQAVMSSSNEKFEESRKRGGEFRRWHGLGKLEASRNEQQQREI